MTEKDRRPSPRYDRGGNGRALERRELAGDQGDGDTSPQLVASEVKPSSYSFLWAPWIPLGHLALVEGDEGVGKSLFLARLCADVTGGPRIDGGRRRRPGRWVLYLAGEESLAGSVVPRLRAAGADLGRVSFGPAAGANGRAWRPELPRDLPGVERVLRQVRPALLILEPVVSFFGREVDWRRDQDAHAVLDPLVMLAGEYGVAVVGARHWTKSATGPALARGMGSRAVSGCAAVVVQLCRCEGPGGGYVMACPKNRLGPPLESRLYAIASVEGGAVFRLGAASALKVDELARPTSLGGAEKMLAARLLLRAKLARGWVPAADIVSACKRDGISDTILYEAKAMDKVRHRWNTATEPKRSEWCAPRGGWEPLDG